LHEDTLASVLANRPPHSEVLVVHPGPYSDPYELGDEVRFLEADADATRLQLVNLGAEEAEGDILHILCGGYEATENWTEDALRQFADAKVVSVAPLVTDVNEQTVVSAGLQSTSSGRRKLLRAASPRSTELARVAPLGPTLESGFYRIECWDAASGVDETMGPAADADLGLCLSELGECRLAAASVVHARSESPAALGYQAGRCAIRLQRRYAHKRTASGAAFRSQAAFSTLTGCLRPSTWAQLLGYLAARNDRRDLKRFERRWSDLQAEAAELARLEQREAA
jgi:hypothetical protein